MSNPLVRIAFLDVGQGDTIVISLPKEREAVVVDCIDATSVFAYLRHEEVSVVRALIVTHLHADHYRQAVALIDNCESQTGARCERLVLHTLPEEEVALSFQDDHSGQDRRLYGSFATWMLRNEPRVYFPNNSVKLPIKGILRQCIKFIYPTPALLPFARSAGFNNSSLVLRVDGQQTSALLPGDLEAAGWKLLKTRSLNRHMASADVLKFPHHGAWKEPDGSPGDSAAFLADVKAKTVIISVGTEQRDYRLPDGHVLNTIRSRNLRLLCTQATKKCGGEGVLAIRSQSEGELCTQAAAIGWPSLLAAGGCPCAGTVVIDLAEHVQIARPDPMRHRDKIVRALFPNHQCSV
jgi:competence protein ComEC